MSFFDWLFGGEEEESQTQTQTTKNEPPQYIMAPEYPEAKGARGDIWSKLQAWRDMPGYGAIAPDWGDIWNKASQKVNQYYWGSATSPGVIGKVRSSAARRNVSDSPALEEMIGRMGIEQGQQLGDIASQEALQEALFGEQGRNTWLNAMFNLSNQRPQGTFYSPGSTTTGTTTGTYQTPGAFGDILGIAGSLLGQNMFNQTLQNLFKRDRYNMPYAYPEGLMG